MVSSTKNRPFFRHSAICLAFSLIFVIATASSSIADRIFLDSPDGVQTQATGFTTATDGTTMNVSSGLVTAPDGSTYNFLTRTYTPVAGPAVTYPGPPAVINAPNGVTVNYIQPFGGVGRYDPVVTLPDGTSYRTQYTTRTRSRVGYRYTINPGYVIRTPGNYTMYFRTSAVSTIRPGTVLNAGGAIQPPTTGVSAMVADVIGTNPTLVNSFVLLDASQSDAFYNAYDTTGATGTTADDPPLVVQQMAQALQSGNPIIFVPSITEFNAFASSTAYFEYAPFVMTNLTIYCQVQGFVPPECSGITPGPIGTPGGPQVIPDSPPSAGNTGIDTSGSASATDLTADALGLVFAQMFEGGEQAVNNWMNNWNNEMLPDWQNMTAQWNTAIIDKSRTYGSAIDAQNQVETQLAIQAEEFEAREDYATSETTCVVASNTPAMGKGSYIGRALTRGYSSEVTSGGLNTVGTPAENGAVEDTSSRWKMYARHFCDPASNAGNAGCEPSPLPSPPAPAPYSPEPFYTGLISGPPAVPFRQFTDADISIENFLLRDTIDLDNEEEKLGTYAILRNLVSPKAPDPIPEIALQENPDAQALLIKRREIQALRDMPQAVISGIIGRRASIPGTDPTVANGIRDLRLKAGVDINDISTKPSYNEILLAMTKERFYDPEYFLNVSDMKPAEIKQEQLGVDLLIGVVQQDIYELQEQMNGLLAARASVKINRDSPGEDTAMDAPSTP